MKKANFEKKKISAKYFNLFLLDRDFSEKEKIVTKHYYHKGSHLIGGKVAKKMQNIRILAKRYLIGWMVSL